MKLDMKTLLVSTIGLITASYIDDVLLIDKEWVKMTMTLTESGFKTI